VLLSKDGKRENLQELPEKIKKSMLYYYGKESIKRAQIISINNNHKSVILSMDDSCDIFTSNEKTYFVFFGNCWNIGTMDMEEK
jgi:hypothetical protein